MTEQLDWQSWFTAALIVIMIAALVHGRFRPHHLFIAALLSLVVTGIITPVQAAAGFTSTAVLTVGALFVVAAGVQHTGLLSYLDRYLLPKKGGTGATLLRIMGSTSVMSSFLNNTPIVAMFTPQLQQWSRKIGIPITKLLIPLSYAAIVGGTITLIGTSTNLIVSEMLSERGYAPFSLFQLAWIGIPATILVVAWFVVIGHRFLPDRPGPDLADVQAEAPAQIVRPGTTYFERRVFDGNFAFASPLGGGNWPSGVYTTGRSRFDEGQDEQPRHGATTLPVLLILIAMIAGSASGIVPVHWAVITAAVVMIATGCLPVEKISRAVHFPVLIVIAAALGIGSALEQTGLAEVLAFTVIDVTSGFGVIAILAGIYVMTNLLTEMVTNNAAAVLMVPVALSTSVALGIDPQAAGVTVAVAASASFLSPIGYQTNLMIMKPGGYRFTDFTKAGLPVTLILMVVTVGMVSWLWI